MSEYDNYKDVDGNVLREYVSPEQLAEYQATGLWPDTHRPCLLCQRFEELERLTQHIKVSDDYVFSLKLSQVLSHLDMELIFKQLPNLSNLELSYGVKKIGMKFDKSLFGMKISDAMSLAKCIKMTDTLTTLVLPSNLMDDDLLRMLMTGLIHNQTITHLDLSHNKITNHGVRLLAKLLGTRSVIMSLNLADNQIHADGGKYLGRALQRNDSLIELNVRLNRLEDDGGRMLFEGIRDNVSLTSVNVSHNNFRSETAKVFATCVGDPGSQLMSADASGNLFSDADAALIRSALDGNATLTSLDLRGNEGIPSTSEHLSAIQTLTRRNELELRKILA
jgi:Ran GTPase-activating protein (RanGAP) involved in mRNA processing and transport